MAARQLTPADILEPEQYAQTREEHRRRLVALKRNRRMEVGPFATFYFECYDTMWYQVHEMLRIERGGAAQLADELSAYNPLIPNGQELVATVMFEIDDERRRQAVLSRLGGVEETAFLQVAGDRVVGRPEADVDRTSETGKASSVQFLHFPFGAAQIATFREPGSEIVLGFEHPNYAHMAVMPDVVRRTLSEDFD